MLKQLFAMMLFLISTSSSLRSQDVFDKFDELATKHKKLADEFKKISRSIRFSENQDILISNGKTIEVHKRPTGCFWDSPFFSKNGNYMGIIANRGSKFGGFTPFKAYLISLVPMKSKKVVCLNDILKDYSFPNGGKDATIHSIIGISNSGKNIIIEVKYSLSSLKDKSIEYSIRDFLEVKIPLKKVSGFTVKD